jgi:hypothetical protein
LPLTTIRAVLGERGEMTQEESEDGDPELRALNPDKPQRCLHERSPLVVRRARQRDLVPLHDVHV